jgi:uncharacterized protein YdaU (DUF1376 family)
MNYYRRYCGDYAADTPHLTMLEHGAYTLMLDAYYTAERPLPTTYDLLYRICRAQTAQEKQAVRNVSEQFFPSDGEFRRNARADKELAIAVPKMAKLREVARENGKKNRPKGQPKPEPDPVPEPAPDQIPSDIPSLKQPPTANHQPPEEPKPENRFPGDQDITAPPSKAGGAHPQVNPEASARVIAECVLAKLHDPTADNPIIARWIRNAYTTTQVITALVEASRARNAPKPLTSAYVDPILERIVADDRKARAAADAKLANTQAIIAESKARIETTTAPPEELIGKYAKRRAA